jgi:putative ABC transport system substrate-binding protein
MTRRGFIALLGTAAARPGAGRAQPLALPVIGYLGPESPEPFASRVLAFRDGLASTGYDAGRNVAIDFRWAEGRYDRLPALAAELAGRQVAVIAAPGGAPVALAAKSATTAIPVVFEMGGDPIALGVVGSLSRPEGNLTGVSSLSVEASPKRLEILHEVVRAARDDGAAPLLLGVVANPTSPTAMSQVGSLQTAAEALGVRIHVLQASVEAQFGPVFHTLTGIGARGVVFTSDPFFAFRGQQLAALAIRHAMPAITQTRDFAIAGGLLSYGGDFVQSHRQAGIYAGLILKGARPAELPVQRVTKLELFINLDTARRFGLTLPLTLLGRADEVIE